MPSTEARFIAAVAVALTLAVAPAAHAAVAGDLVLVSRADGASGASGNASSQLPSVSTDGRLVAFASSATNLTADTVPAGVTQAYVRDIDAGTTLLASAAANANVSDAGVSDDGRYVVFGTRATNLGPTAAGIDRVFVHDFSAHTTTLVAENAVRPAISADGSTIALCSNANIAGTGATGASLKVYAYDVQGHTFQLVSRGDGNGTAFTGDNPSLSSTGRYVAFSGQGGTASVWIRDRQASTTQLVSRASGTNGEQASSAAIEPDISGDGRYVVFRSAATNLSDDDVDTSDDIFERDVIAATTTLVSRADGATGAGASGDSDLPSVSDDGARVFFRSRSANLSTQDNDNGDNGFVRDTLAGTTTLVHGRVGQTPPPQGVMNGLAMAGNGRYAVYASNATLLPAEETGSFGDVFRRDLGAAPPPPPLPSASIGADQTVGEGAGTATFAVTLSAADARPVKLDWATADGTATAGADYRGATGQVTIAPGQTTAYISVDVLDDRVHEDAESFSIVLANPQNATLGRASAQLTITDDDATLLPPPAGTPAPTPVPPTGLAPTSGPPATACATQVTQGLAVLRGCFSGGRATGVVALNGLTVVLGSSSIVVTDAKLETNGSVSVFAGDVLIGQGALSLDPRVGTAVLTPPSGAGIYGLQLQPRLALSLAAGGVANLAGYVTLPLGGTPLRLTFSASDHDGLRRATLAAAADTISAGKLLATGVKFAFNPASATWRGGLALENKLFPWLAVKLNGSIDRSGALIANGPLGNFNGLHVRTSSVTLGTNPLSLGGALGFDAGPFNLLSFDGSIKYTLGTGQLQLTGTTKIFGLTLGRPGLSPFSGLTGSVLGGGMALGGTAPLVFGKAPDAQAPPAPASGPLGALLGGTNVGGALPGLNFGMNPLNGSFLGGGDGSFNILGAKISGQASANSKGFAVCGQIGFLQAGFGVNTNPFSIQLMGPLTCDVGPWKTNAASAQAGGSRSLTLPAGVQIVRLRGSGPATLHGPGGQVIDTAAAPQVGAGAIVLSDGDTTFVALKQGKGAWTIDGPRITSVDYASQMPKAKVTARVAKGAVKWTERVSPGQKVVLAESAGALYHELGTLRGAKGTLRFTPLPGGGRRSIVAVVTEGGLPMHRLTVARFTAPAPPKPARPGKVAVKLAKAKLTVSWAAARNAKSYLVTAKTPNGTLVAQASARHATLTDILPVTKATVTVTGVGADGRRGPARTVSAKPGR